MSSETPTSRGAPMSPRPHLFGTPPPRTPSSTTSTSSSTLNSTSSSNPSATSDHPRVPGMSPDLPARVLPSDLLTMEDYRKIRYEATKRTFLYGAVGALAGVLGVRQFARGKMGPNGLVLVGFGSGLASGVYGSVSYLRSEISQWREKADNLSIPTTEDGSPLFSDKTILSRDTTPDLRDLPSSPSALDGPGMNRVDRYTPDKSRWDQLGQGGQDQLRDPFFRPGVPRRDA